MISVARRKLEKGPFHHSGSGVEEFCRDSWSVAMGSVVITTSVDSDAWWASRTDQAFGQYGCSSLRRNHHSQAFAKHSMTMSSSSLDTEVLFEVEFAMVDAIRAGRTLLSTFFDNVRFEWPVSAGRPVLDDDASAL